MLREMSCKEGEERTELLRRVAHDYSVSGNISFIIYEIMSLLYHIIYKICLYSTRIRIL